MESLKHETQWNAAPKWAGAEGSHKVLWQQTGTISSTIPTDSRDFEWVKKKTRKKGYPELQAKPAMLSWKTWKLEVQVKKELYA